MIWHEVRSRNYQFGLQNVIDNIGLGTCGIGGIGIVGGGSSILDTVPLHPLHLSECQEVPGRRFARSK